ncbi:MAG: hypothetical protein HC876_11155, partial [Chloroflexaceae bacterium]|nr:hypothetical protein [Chloroflexaceae bacterium]
EAALLQYANRQDPSFFDTQGDHIVRVVMRGMAIGIKSFVWFTLHSNDWLSGGLLETDGTPRAPYYAYQTLIEQAGDTTTVTSLTSYGSAIEAYRFDKGSLYVDVLWSKDNTADTVEVLRPAFVTAFDREGNVLEPTYTETSAVFQVDYSPIYIHSLPVNAALVPQITGVSPEEGINDGPTRLTISGTNFNAAATVALDSTTLANPTIIGTTSIQVDVPAGFEVGTYDVIVTNPGGWASRRTNAFTLLSSNPPEIAAVNPPYGRAGVASTIHVYGSNFATGATITFGSVALTTTRVNGAHLFGVLPSSNLSSNLYDVTVTNPDESADTLKSSFRIFRTSDDAYDLLGYSSDFWTTPSTVRLGQQVDLGVGVLRLGKQAAVQPAVDIGYIAPDNSATTLGTVNLAIPENPRIADAVISGVSFPNAGTYILRAVIDPQNEYLELSDSNNVVTRTLTVLPTDSDSVPPTITSLTVNNGSSTTSERNLQLAISTSDAGTFVSGVAAAYVVEYDYNWAVNDWVAVQQSQTWVPYQVGQQFAWSLVPTPGVKYLRVWLADVAGNISAPATVVINYLPTQNSLTQTDAHLYRYRLEAGDTLNLTLNATAGMVDLYVWSPGGGQTLAATGRIDGNFATSVPAATTGIYQIEIHGFAEAVYSLTATRQPGNSTAPGLTQGVAQPDPLRSGPIVGINNEPRTTVRVPNAPATPTETSTVYLPRIRR